MQSTKRSAEDFARVHHGQQPSKRARFDVRNPSALAPDALEEDITLDADVIGTRGQQVKRGAVNVDGYDSDSENENFDARAAARDKALREVQKSQAEDENDMFAELEEDLNKDGDDSEGDADRRGGIKKKKDVRFLDEDEIEGQVRSSKSGGHVSADFSLNGKRQVRDEEQESSSDSDVDDATRADAGDVDEELGAGAKKTHAPKLDAFNMREENEEGRFDDQGNYVRKAADVDAKYDTWMDGISKKDMKKASDAQEKRERERRQKAIEDDSKSDADVLASLLPWLQPSETVLEALARLNKGKKSVSKWQRSKKKPTNTSQEDNENTMSNPDAARTKAIEAITEAADLLLTRGQPEIYDTERELLVRQYKKVTGEDWQEPDPATTTTPNDDGHSGSWQYRWSDARDGGDIHGPYDVPTMKAWSEAGYFGDGVEFRRVGDTTWSRVLDVQ